VRKPLSGGKFVTCPVGWASCKLAPTVGPGGGQKNGKSVRGWRAFWPLPRCRDAPRVRRGGSHEASPGHSETPYQQETVMKVQTNVKAGGLSLNHNAAAGLKVKTNVKAGGRQLQHNAAVGLKVKT